MTTNHARTEDLLVEGVRLGEIEDECTRLINRYCLARRRKNTANWVGVTDANWLGRDILWDSSSFVQLTSGPALWRLLITNDRQRIPKKLYKKLRAVAQKYPALAATSDKEWVRSLLEPFKWKWAPDWINKEHIKKLQGLHTKTLLHMHRMASRGYFDEINESFSPAEIKKVLDMREHIMNKPESKAFRKRLIKQGR